MELKQYQQSALDAFDAWCKALDVARETAVRSAKALEQAGQPVPDAVRDFPRTAWGALAAQGGVAEPRAEYVARSDGAGHPIPHVCLKVPTGGGKTLLAAAALERLDRQTGLVLWIVPSRAIYAQTRAALWNRMHPYRQMLERASGGRVKTLEKDQQFTRADTENYLCVMLLMLPAVNHQQNKDFLRIFRDSGRYPTLFPDADDPRAEAALLEGHPDLERNGGDGPIRHSLFNVLKMLRPVVVLDEAHKAYGRKSAGEFVRAVNHLDPSLVIELSATPNRRISNLLVDVTGVELKQEEMIKLPVQVTSFGNVGWRDTLARAHDLLDDLDAEAQSLHAAEGRYIRPIAVVRVERTGKGQRDGVRVHAEDVREHLVERLGAAPESVRVKSSDLDEIAGEDLLSPLSPVRWIVTQSALREGWDCPFASLLVILDATRSQTALTQLVGRVMRQPHARRTGREALDQCYVYCWQIAVSKAVDQVKRGLEHEGLTGLVDDVRATAASDTEARMVQRRERFRGRDIFLPKVLHRDGEGGLRNLDYQRDILPEIDWASIEAPAEAELPGANGGPAMETTAVDLGGALPSTLRREALAVNAAVTLDWFARRLDLVPNPWQAARIAGERIAALRAGGLDDDAIHAQRGAQASNLRKHVVDEIERRAEQVFREKLRAGDIRFDLEVGESNFRMPDSIELRVAPNEGQIASYGQPVQRSLFEMAPEHDFNELEREYALYLDEREAIRWWHRVAARQQHEYYLRGWKPGRIFPDFVALSEDEDESTLLISETKGDLLREHPDTEYKQKVLAALEQCFNERHASYQAVPVHDVARGRFRVVFREDFAQSLA